jgi:uncharacterized membrane protein (UPF0127 family)
MSEFWRKLTGQQGKAADAPAPALEERFVAFNVTRSTELADQIELAGGSAKRSKGLLGRNGLGPGEGLWIVPCEAVHTFWMRFSIDLVYLDRHNRIAKIRTNVPPWRLSACLTAHSIVELPAGSVAPTLARPGDQLEFRPVSSAANANGLVNP